MTSSYYHLGHDLPLVPLEQKHPLAVKWNHSIVQEQDFKSEWQAVDNALNLAFELGSWKQREQTTWRSTLLREV